MDNSFVELTENEKNEIIGGAAAGAVAGGILGGCVGMIT